MGNKEIQRQRMMNYFIEAAKEIIQEEGVTGITVRKVGDRAGYSYATIYNYFSDIKGLLGYCIVEFLADCFKYVARFKDDILNPLEQFIIYSVSYFKYMAQNPNIFQLVFLEDMENLLDLQEQNMEPDINRFMYEEIKKCADQGYIEHNQVKIIHDLIGNYIHGKLLFLLKGRGLESINEITTSMDEQIRFIMNERCQK